MRIGHLREAQADGAEPDAGRWCGRPVRGSCALPCPSGPHACGRSSCTTDLAQASSSASACSATAAALAPTAATTSMPRACAAALSMVSVPLPCLEITLSAGRRVHDRRAHLAVAHDDGHRVMRAAQGHEVVFGGRLARVDDLVALEEGRAPAARGRRPSPGWLLTASRPPSAHRPCAALHRATWRRCPRP